ncbi:MAG: HAD hydrolase family protein [Terriglobia bacterium]|jgi:3-deoxy-D-manno-octulosonate 8-phosphate phosphatase (KDO 8-P phosphatase)
MAKYSRKLLARAKKIKLLLMDVDGVMTDGKFYYVPRPGGGMLETKAFDSRDGLGLRLAHHAGLKTGIITGRSSPVIEYRVKDLGIHFLQQNALEKIEPYERIRNAAQVEDAEVCYVGDDLTDLPLLTRVGLGVCVANGDDLVRKHAHFCTRRAGGSGAVRDAIELILIAQGKWDAILKSYLQGDRAIILKHEAETEQTYPLRPESPRRTARGGGLPNPSK